MEKNLEQVSGDIPAVPPPPIEQGKGGQDGSAFARNIPRLIVGSIGLIYAIGFLIVFTHLSRFGLKDTGDFFRAKYLQVGLMYCIFTGIILVPTISFLIAKNRVKNLIKIAAKQPAMPGEKLGPLRQENHDTWNPSYVVIMLWLIIFNIVAFFGPSTIIHQHYPIIIINFLPIIGITISRELFRFIKRKPLGQVDIPPKELNNFEIGAAKILMITMIVLFVIDIFEFYEVFGTMYEMIKEGGIFYFACVILFGLYFYRTYSYIVDINDNRIYYSLMAFGICFVFTIFYFTVITFGLFVYSYIPSNKGGGDYSYSQNAIIQFNTKLPNDSPILFLSNKDNPFYSNPVKLIEEANEFIYVAEASDAGGPAEWRKRRKKEKPKIFAIRRECVSCITYTDKKIDVSPLKSADSSKPSVQDSTKKKPKK